MNTVKGKTCNKRHPKRCYKFCDFGANSSRRCNKGKACDFWHPRLCTASRKNEVCKNNNCTFQHLAHTRESVSKLGKLELSQNNHERERGDKRATKATEKRDDKRDESSFLLKLIEEMRAGINEQLQVMRAELRGCKMAQASTKIPVGAANTKAIPDCPAKRTECVPGSGKWVL